MIDDIPVRPGFFAEKKFFFFVYRLSVLALFRIIIAMP